MNVLLIIDGPFDLGWERRSGRVQRGNAGIGCGNDKIEQYINHLIMIRSRNPKNLHGDVEVNQS